MLSPTGAETTDAVLLCSEESFLCPTVLNFNTAMFVSYLLVQPSQSIRFGFLKIYYSKDHLPTICEYELIILILSPCLKLELDFPGSNI